ncbi:hypothetical protein AOG23_24135 [Rhizobium acidisoli]|nr:hypothetical protein AOG23_24135 [Rhizobium acidisoli]
MSFARLKKAALANALYARLGDSTILSARFGQAALFTSGNSISRWQSAIRCDGNRFNSRNACSWFASLRRRDLNAERACTIFHVLDCAMSGVLCLH